MIDINESYITDDLDMLSEIFNPVEEKTIKLEEGENRVVSILFLDVKGFTAMSEQMKPEAVKRTMDKILTVFTNSILKYGGYIDKYEGDLIMALFGSKITSETDTERAINAGLKILKDLKHVNKILKIDLAVRIGINTGEVSTGKIGMKREGDFTVYGDAVNLASRMESSAPLNSIMIPNETREIVKDYFIFEDLGDITVKGKEKPISVFKILKKNPQKIERWERSRASIKHSLYVGRDKELEIINVLYNSSKHEIGSVDKEYKPLVIGLKGDAGLGKSRLVKEFTDRVDKSHKTTLSGYTKSYAQPAYCIWTTMFKKYFKIEEDDKKDIIKDKLDKAYAELILINNAEKDLIDAKSVIGFMFGVKYEDIRLEKVEPKTLQTLIVSSARHTIEAIAFKVNSEFKRPLIIYFDDCQWLDESSIHLLKTFLATLNVEEKKEERVNKNLIFLLTYRPEFKPFKEFKFDSQFKKFELSPLTSDFSKDLIDSMLGQNTLSDKFITKTVRNSGGNPFYIEELVNYLIEKEQIIKKDDIWRVAKGEDDIHIPLSLTNIILSRIDNLSDDYKNILQKASVIGHHFVKTILKEVTSKIDKIDIKEKLSQLESDNWIYNEDDDEKYFFKHILTSEVCYKTLLRYNKKIVHRIIAETTEEIFKDNKDYYGFIANHYEKSEAEVGSLEYDKAIEYMEKAGDYAKESYQNEKAIEFYKRLLSGNFELSDELRIDLLLKKGVVLQLIGRWDDAFVDFEYSLDRAEKLGDKSRIAKANGSIGFQYRLKGDYTRAMECYEKKLKISEELGDKSGISKAVGNMGIVYDEQGDYTRAIECYEKRLKISEELGDKRGISIAVGNMGIVYHRQGDYTRARDCYEKQLKISEELGDKSGISIAVGNMGIVYHRQGDYTRARDCYEKQLKISEELGDKSGISISVGNMGLVYSDQGDYTRAMEYYDRAISIGEELNIKYLLCEYLFNKANLLYITTPQEANIFNTKAQIIASEVENKEYIFKSNILKEKIEFKLSDNSQTKLKNIENLKNMLKYEKDDTNIATINYELSTMNYELKLDNSEYKKVAIYIYKKLYKKTPNIEYKNRFEELEKL